MEAPEPRKTLVYSCFASALLVAWGVVEMLMALF